MLNPRSRCMPKFQCCTYGSRKSGSRENSEGAAGLLKAFKGKPRESWLTTGLGVVKFTAGKLDSDIERGIITRIRDAQRTCFIGRIKNPVTSANHGLISQLKAKPTRGAQLLRSCGTNCRGALRLTGISGKEAVGSASVRPLAMSRVPVAML